MEDLRWLGFQWQEGPDLGGPAEPYRQSDCWDFYHQARELLRRQGWIYPCYCSRKDLSGAPTAPHEQFPEPIYPGTCRPAKPGAVVAVPDGPVNWRFRVPDGTEIDFPDALQGPQHWVAGKDFGDFLVWRKDGWPSYQLAVVVDDLRMGITEVVRGADLLLSTGRQIFLYEAFGAVPPAWCHCPLVQNLDGKRLAKRDPTVTLQALRAAGYSPEQLISGPRLDSGG